jgi:hypothetical protein
MRAVLRFTLLAFAIPGLLIGRESRADELAVDRATALFNEGRRMMREGRYAEACARFEQSLELSEGVGTEFNLADCWERLGRLASAQALFAKVAAAAAATGRHDREKTALKRSAALEPRLARLAIELDGETRDALVRRNGEPVEFEALGKPLPVDPGTYDVEVTAAGNASWTKSVRVPPGTVVWITVPPLEAAVPPPSPTEPAAEPGGRGAKDALGSEAEPPTPDPERTPDSPAPRAKPQIPHAATFGLLALGVGGVAAGTAFTLKHRSAAEDAGNVCRIPAACTPDDLDRYEHFADDAKASRTGAFISFGIGGAALVGAAITHWVFGLRPEQPQAGLLPQPVVTSRGSWGLVSRGRF